MLFIMLKKKNVMEILIELCNDSCNRRCPKTVVTFFEASRLGDFLFVLFSVLLHCSKIRYQSLFWYNFIIRVVIHFCDVNHYILMNTENFKDNSTFWKEYSVKETSLLPIEFINVMKIGHCEDNFSCWYMFILPTQICQSDEINFLYTHIFEWWSSKWNQNSTNGLRFWTMNERFYWRKAIPWIKFFIMI